MKVCIIQPEYSADYGRSEELFNWELAALDRCDGSMDLIVLPESTDVPAFAKKREQALASHEKYAAALLEKASQTAARCNAVLFINAYRETPTGLRNTTYAFDRTGAEVGHYYKQHLTPGETSERKLDSDYTFSFSSPDILEIDGVRYAFMTCYDFYFYEAFANIARFRPDVIIGCSHQRSDSHAALEMMTRFCAYNTNAWVVRSSVSMGEDSATGGASMIVSPKGEIVADLYSQIGHACADIDPHEKYYKPGGYNNPEMAHWEYLEKGRRPWKYRPAGSAIVPPDAIMPYPRMCAHRGFSTIAPENSLPAYGAAVALGAEEIEFDLWYTADGEIVSIHDSRLDRVSDGTGFVYEKTYEELLQYDFGVKFGEAYRGLKILKFEDILAKFACQTIMNIHIKTVSNDVEWDEALLVKLIGLIDRYDCRKHVYFMTGNDFLMRQLKRLAPDICRCVGGGKDPWGMVERALEIGCQKVQLFKGKFDQAMIDRAHANGIRCNVFWSDDVEETKEYLRMGIDTILTNDYWKIAQVIR